MCRRHKCWGRRGCWCVCAHVEGTGAMGCSANTQVPKHVDYTLFLYLVSLQDVFHSRCRQIHIHIHAHLRYEIRPGSCCECNFLLLNGSLMLLCKWSEGATR